MTRFLLAALVLILPALPAAAKLEVCNQTDTRHEVAIGYGSSGDWTSEGWWHIDPGACVTVIGDDLRYRYYYYRARAAGHDYDGEYAFCVDSAAFTIKGDTDCAGRGYSRELFREEDTGPTAREWTLVLNGAPVASAPAPAPQPAPVPPPANALGFEYADFDSGMAPGQLGEPFTIEGRFLECQFVEGDRFCLWAADGWTWSAYQGSGTPSFAFDAMEVLTPGQRVIFRGDVVSYGDSSVEAVVRGFQAITEVTELDRIWAALQGQFVSLDDANYEASIQTNLFFGFYQDEITESTTWRVQDGCNGFEGPAMIRLEGETGDSQCYLILEWSAAGFTTAPPGNWNETRWRKR